MAVITDMESALPQSKDATVWETEEQAVRYIMEDGKLNLLLRSAIDYKSYTRLVINTPEELNMRSHIKSCEQFEAGIGGILRACWLHVEGVQVTDIPAFCKYVQDVLQHALSSGSGIQEMKEAESAMLPFLKRQEVLVTGYIGLILSHLEILRESRIMPEIRTRGIFMLAVRFLLQAVNYLPEEKLMKDLEALVTLVQTEDFVTYRSDYLTMNNNNNSTGSGNEAVDTEELLAAAVEDLQALKSEILAGYMKGGAGVAGETRRLLRPLVDEIDKCRRMFGSKK